MCGVTGLDGIERMLNKVEKAVKEGADIHEVVNRDE